MTTHEHKYVSNDGEDLYVCFWKAHDHHRLQTNDPDVVRKVKTWSFAHETGWGWNVYMYIFYIPNEKAKWVLKHFGFESAARSEKQQAATRRLIKQGHGHRFNVNRSGQEFCSQAHSGHKNFKGIPYPSQTMNGSPANTEIQKGYSEYEECDR